MAITIVQRNKKGCIVFCYAKGYSGCRKNNLYFFQGEKGTTARD